MAISPDGRTVLVDGLGSRDGPADLWRSTDGGRTFRHLEPRFGAVGGGDWDMRWLDDHTVIAADLSFPDGIYVHRSVDRGDTWTSTKISMDLFDRPWIEHVGPDKVFLVAKAFEDGIPYLFRSTDGGRSFGAPPVPILVYGLPQNGGPDPVTGFVTSQAAYIDHLAVGRGGDVYVLYGVSHPDTIGPGQPVGASNHLYVAHLEGDRMVSHVVRLGGPDDAFLAGFNWLTVDRGGTVYALANGRVGGHWSARLSFSKDKGVTWSPLVDLGARGPANVYGSIAGGDPGVLSLVYLQGSNDDPSTAQNWYAEVARVTGADSARPDVVRSRPMAKPIHTADICFDGIVCGLPGFGRDRNLLDYIWNAIAPDGTAYAVVTSDGPATGRNGDTGGQPDVVVLRQSGGPRHGRGVPS